MSSRLDAAKSALRTIRSLSMEQHSNVLDALERAGVFDGNETGAVHAGASNVPVPFKHIRNGAVLTMVQAASNPANLELLRIVKASANRYGVGEFFEDATKPINFHALNNALREKKVDLDDRFRFKEALYLLKLIPA